MRNSLDEFGEFLKNASSDPGFQEFLRNYGDKFQGQLSALLTDHDESLQWYVEQVRSQYETFQGEARPMLAMTLRRTSAGVYRMHGLLYIPEMPPPDMAIALLTQIYEMADVNGLILAADTWSYSDEMMEKIQPQLKQLVECDDPELAAEIEFLIPRPTDVADEDRIEVSAYWALSDDGEFVTAEQRRGLEHPLQFLEESDPTSVEYMIGSSRGFIPDGLRRIVGIK